MPDPALRDAVLTACSVRDDPRFLARIAFGIVSPRVMPMRLGRDPVFGSMNVCDFMVSLPGMPPTPPDPALIDEVLTTCSTRDDPRFLARIAFGIVSPRVDLPEEIEKIVLPATITFGMGIDKPNIRNIVLFDMPPRYYSGVPVVI
ncbi:hypothetical protein V8E54_002249 [Elaphomyces granulatus]